MDSWKFFLNLAYNVTYLGPNTWSHLRNVIMWSFHSSLPMIVLPFSVEDDFPWQKGKKQIWISEFCFLYHPLAVYY